MPETYALRVFSTTNLLGSDGNFLFGQNLTNAFASSGTTTYTHGTDAGIRITVVDDDPAGATAPADSLEFFDDGAGSTTQELGEDLTITYATTGAAGQTATQTFAAGTTIQSEAIFQFADGTRIIAIRVGGPSPDPQFTIGYAFLDAAGNPSDGPAPAGTNLGVVVDPQPDSDPALGLGDGSVSWAVVVCFVAGAGLTLDASGGPIPIEAIREGDMILTLDRGYQPVRAVARLDFTASQVAADPRLAPVMFDNGAGRPIALSRSHRVLFSDPRLDMLVGFNEALAPAHWLAERARLGVGVRYIHVAFDRHELVRCNGVWVESLYRAAAAVTAEDAALRGLLSGGEGDLDDYLVRPMLKRHEWDVLRSGTIPTAA